MFSYRKRTIRPVDFDGDGFIKPDDGHLVWTTDQLKLKQMLVQSTDK